MTTALSRLATCRPGRVLLLDGPTGTELERRGFATRMPLWTATVAVDAPELLRAIHMDYVAAGADILTACTFRTSHHTLSKAGFGSDAAHLTRHAVALAREAADATERVVLVAGSVAPLEDCYKPELTPDVDVLAKEHQTHADTLVEAGADILLVESMPTAREAIIATRAAVATGTPVITSLLARDNAQLFDGTPLSEVLPALLDLPIELIAVNCCSTQACSRALQELARTGRPFGAYANAGEPDGSFGRDPEPHDVSGYGEAVLAWLDAGATLVGGCCGTQPQHIAHLRELIDERHTVVIPASGPRSIT